MRNAPQRKAREIKLALIKPGAEANLVPTLVGQARQLLVYRDKAIDERAQVISHHDDGDKVGEIAHAVREDSVAQTTIMTATESGSHGVTTPMSGRGR
jgi:hypothetical protein